MPVNYNDAARIAYLQWLDAEDSADQEWVRTLREYASGEHPTYLTDRQEEFLGLKAKDSDHLYAHNLCQLVIDTVVERLSVEEFVPVEESALAADADPAQWAMDWWEANRMDAGQDDVYSAACRDGVTYLIVDWDPIKGAPRWSLNEAYDGTQGVKMVADPNSGESIYAVKVWQVYDPYNSDNNGRTRRTYYFPDRVEKYISTKDSNDGIGGTQWEPYSDAQGEPWPIPWLDSTGVPLGLPVFEFANPGGSEIAQMVGPQDMLNKSDLDAIAGADAAGFRILYATGVPPSIDKSTGEEATLKVGPGRLLRFTDAAAKLAALDPVDTNLLIAASKYWVETIASITRTPQYLFQALGADMPSGESLKEQEIGLIFKCERRQRVWGNVWEDIIGLSAKLSNLYGGTAIEPIAISCEWKAAQLPADPIAEETAKAQARKLAIDAGLPLVTVLRREGWTEEEIEAMLADKSKADAERTSMATALLEQARTQFDQGQNPAAQDMMGQEEQPPNA